jgi:hypothetical protein
MSSLADLRDGVKARYILTNSDLDNLIDTYINQAYRKYGRRFGWKQLYVENATLTLTAGTQTYNLPSAFWRINPDSIRYDYVSSSDPGNKLTLVQYDGLATYKLLAQASQPCACAVVDGSTGSLKAMEFFPPFTDTNKTVRYDYWASPTALTEDADDPAVDDFEEVIIYDALVQLALYHNRTEQAQMFKGELREQLNVALQGINAN